MERTFIEQQHYLVEDFHEVHVVIAEFLHLNEQVELGGACLGEVQEEGTVHLCVCVRVCVCVCVCACVV